MSARATTPLMLDGAYSNTFNASGDLLLAVAWLAGLAVAVYLLLHRAVGVRT